MDDQPRDNTSPETSNPTRKLKRSHERRQQNDRRDNDDYMDHRANYGRTSAERHYRTSATRRQGDDRRQDSQEQSLVERRSIDRRKSQPLMTAQVSMKTAMIAQASIKTALTAVTCNHYIVKIREEGNVLTLELTPH